MHALILAGGFGTRLKSVVADVPKPLAPINGRPFLELLIARLVSQGVTSVTLSVHHMKEAMQQFVAEQSFNIPVDVVVEEKPLGTGGAMVFCLSKIKDKSDKPVLVLNGDSFVKVDCRRLYAHHLAKETKLTLTLRKVPDTSRYGKVITRNNIVTKFLTLGDAGPGFINAGVYVMSPDLFAPYGMPEAFSFERDFLPQHVKRIKPHTFIADDYFIDIGVPEDYARAQEELPKIVGQSL